MMEMKTASLLGAFNWHVARMLIYFSVQTGLMIKAHVFVLLQKYNANAILFLLS